MFFNDNDPHCVQWLRNLWPDAEVNSQSVTELTEVTSERAHFFAGIGGWELALQMAGWPEDYPVWTGSLPCQPFSTAGYRNGEADERHLWPQFRRLIEQYRPPVIFGEQVASKLGREWLSRVRADLEALGYGVGAADLCAAGVGAPHIRQRLYWVAYSPGLRRPARGPAQAPALQGDGALRAGQLPQPGDSWQLQGRPQGLRRDAQRLAYSECSSQEQGRLTVQPAESPRETRARPSTEPGRCSNSDFWSSYEVVELIDGSYRRVEPGSFPLAPRVSSTVGRIRGYGNAIVPPLAAVFIKSFMEAVEL